MQEKNLCWKLKYILIPDTPDPSFDILIDTD